MSYLQPQSVTAPKDCWTFIGVVYDRGEEETSVAFGEWKGDFCLVARWNGSLDDPRREKGNPISHQHPTWFVLPDFMAQGTLKECLMLHATGDKRVNHDVLLRAINALSPSSNVDKVA
jgi:hypothetical protein